MVNERIEEDGIEKNFATNTLGWRCHINCFYTTYINCFSAIFNIFVFAESCQCIACIVPLDSRVQRCCVAWFIGTHLLTVGLIPALKTEGTVKPQVVSLCLWVYSLVIFIQSFIFHILYIWPNKYTSVDLLKYRLIFNVWYRNVDLESKFSSTVNLS